MDIGLSKQEISFVQAALNLVQHGDALKVDGMMGDQTKEAVKKFQMGHHEAPSGVVSRDTVDALIKELQTWNKNHNWVHGDER